MLSFQASAQSVASTLAKNLDYVARVLSSDFFKSPNSAYFSRPMTSCIFFLKFKSTHPIDTIFDEIRII